MGCKPRVCRKQFVRGLRGFGDGVGVGRKVGHRQGREAVLPLPEKVAGAAQLEVLAGDFKAVV
ncbi:hypothetical protein SDC9_164678 [bioreactor metagenome]|uniref:Uncharacterized protein n=1 Tax=bioreactor metagenome TaxID=1076179 RepID=A0A645FS95_9ZZZZ